MALRFWARVIVLLASESLLHCLLVYILVYFVTGVLALSTHHFETRFTTFFSAYSSSIFL